MCSRFSKVFIVLLVLCLVCGQLFAFSLRKSEAIQMPTEATAEVAAVPQTISAEPVAVPQIVPTRASENSQILSDLTAKTRLTAEQAEAIADLRVAVADLEAVNGEALDRVDALEARIRKDNGFHFGLGLGVTYDNDTTVEFKDMLGLDGMLTIRKGKTLVLAGLGYPKGKEFLKGNINGNNFTHRIAIIREF